MKKLLWLIKPYFLIILFGAINIQASDEKESKFLQSFKISLSDFHKEKLLQIDNFDYSKVLKKVDRDSGGLTDKYLEEGMLALKKYYAVALLDPLNEHAVSLYVDPFWHSHVLFTKDYTKFCNSIFGGYIHHSPLDPDDTKEVERVGSLYNYTISIYDQIFKEYDKNWWPSLERKSQGFSAVKPICFHYLVKDTEIMQKALFKPNSIEQKDD